MKSDKPNTRTQLVVPPTATPSESDLYRLFEQFAKSLKNATPKLKTSQAINIYGIDTLHLGFNIELTASQLIGWVELQASVVQEKGSKQISKKYTQLYRTESGTTINFKYIPVDYRGNANLLLVQFASVPKVTGICNHSQVQDWENTIDLLNETLSKIPFLPKMPDVRDGIIHEIDLCANFQVGQENVQSFIETLSKSNFPHRATIAYVGTGVTFSGQKKVTGFYCKYTRCKQCEQCNYADALGILRMEIKIRSKREAQKWLGPSNPTLRMVTEQKVILRLEQDLRTLELDKPIQGNLIQRIFKLEGLKQSKIEKLVAYVNRRASFSHEELKQQITPRTVLKYEKWLLEAGLSGQSILVTKDVLPSLLDLLWAGNESKRMSAAQEYKSGEFPQEELDYIELMDLPDMGELTRGENVASCSTEYDSVTSDNFAVHPLSESTSGLPLQTPVQEGNLTIDGDTDILASRSVNIAVSKVDEQYQNTTCRISIQNMTINLEGDVDFSGGSTQFMKSRLLAGPD